METPALLHSMPMFFMISTLLAMIPLGLVRSDGSGPPEVEQVANHGKISYDTVRGVSGGSSR